MSKFVLLWLYVMHYTERAGGSRPKRSSYVHFHSVFWVNIRQRHLQKKWSPGAIEPPNAVWEITAWGWNHGGQRLPYCGGDRTAWSETVDPTFCLLGNTNVCCRCGTDKENSWTQICGWKGDWACQKVQDHKRQSQFKSLSLHKQHMALLLFSYKLHAMFEREISALIVTYSSLFLCSLVQHDMFLPALPELCQESVVPCVNHILRSLHNVAHSHPFECLAQILHATSS